MKAKYQVSIPC
uniref:Uncharacterized protein n=1 Tax=Rhizophora mucronata TaxID=61149 RepID=A0A2P2QI31_RHIMU